MHSCARSHRHRTASQLCESSLVVSPITKGHFDYAIPADVKASLAAQCMQGFLAHVRLVSDTKLLLMIGSAHPLCFGLLPMM